MIRLSENVVQLGNRHFNYFVVGQKQAAVIECGVSGGVHSFEKQWGPWKEQPHVKYLLAMHAHFDHVCGLPALRQLFPEAGILSSKEGQKVLNNPKILADFFSQDDSMSELLIREGIIDADVKSFSADRIVVDEIIGEGDEFELDSGLSIKVIDAPGHSPCGLAAYLPSEQMMFISDAAGFQINDNDIFPVFFQGYEIYMETIKKLMSFPVRILGIPHERIWFDSDIELFYQRAINSAETAFNNIRSMLDDGIDDDIIKSTLVSRYYKDALKIYTPANINLCVHILLRRVKECL
ncbi:MAG: MBL fold metallo-hydrolase [Syntrophomonadaceae bacterium]|nr:MBL fold metallo-hydrolase [Syntrophomonadaceae bacterium]MDD3022668.1 MBL fold metallo-hydrolase [Syntrophomonadaceae bacterium]